MDLVLDACTQPNNANGFLNLQIKLTRTKKALKAWNKEVFGNLHTNLGVAEEAVVSAQSSFEEDPFPSHRTTINEAIAKYILLLKMEEDFWRQKAAMRWLSDEDRNTKFYQSWIKQKRTRLHIHSVQVGDRTI